MRMLWVHLLKDGSTEWRYIPWGKLHLDAVRKQGFLIIGSHE